MELECIMLSEISQLKKDKYRGTWVAQLVKCLTLGFMVWGHGIEPLLGLHHAVEPAWDFSPFLCPSPAHTLSHSLSPSEREREREIPYDFTHMENLRNKTAEIEREANHKRLLMM